MAVLTGLGAGTGAGRVASAWGFDGAGAGIGVCGTGFSAGWAFVNTDWRFRFSSIGRCFAGDGEGAGSVPMGPVL